MKYEINPIKAMMTTDADVICESLISSAIKDARFVEVYKDGEFLLITTRPLASFVQFDGDYQFRAIDQEVFKEDGFVSISKCGYCGTKRAIYSTEFGIDEVVIEGCTDCHNNYTNEMVEIALDEAENTANDYAADCALDRMGWGMER